MFGKFIFAQTSNVLGENDGPTMLAVMWKLLAWLENLPTNMEEDKNSDKHGTTEPQTSFVFVKKLTENGS